MTYDRILLRQRQSVIAAAAVAAAETKFEAAVRGEDFFRVHDHLILPHKYQKHEIARRNAILLKHFHEQQRAV